MQAAVIGAGPAGLMAAETLARAGVGVTVFDRMPSVGRKFLLAGRGGLNLTHSEPFERFSTRYGSAAETLRPILEAFSPERLRAWAEELGQATTVGSSGRVFPQAWKASPLLRAWLKRLDELGVVFRLRHRWVSFGPAGELRFDSPEGEMSVRPDATLLALGGGSWARLGSDGGWVATLRDAGVQVRDLVPANTGLLVAWSETFLARFDGEPLKRIAVSYGGRTVRGEAIVTRRGLEGGAIYAIAGSVRDALAGGVNDTLNVDLRPDLSREDLARGLSRERRKQSLSTFLRKAAGLSPVATGLVREGYGPALPGEPAELAAAIKAVPLRVTGTDSLDRAISSAGGVPFDELDQDLMLKHLPGMFVAGEMLDWEAPTGGYLLQACFATGVAAARGVLARLAPGAAYDSAGTMCSRIHVAS